LGFDLPLLHYKNQNENSILCAVISPVDTNSHAANFAVSPPENESVKRLFAKEVQLESAVKGKQVLRGQL